MKDTVIFQIEYDEIGNPKIRVRMRTSKTRKTFFFNEVQSPKFEDLPYIAQVETLNSLFLRAYKNFDEAEKELITSEKNARNKRDFDDATMDCYDKIVEEYKLLKPGKYWKAAWRACVKYSQENHPQAVYIKISKKSIGAFTKMMTHYKQNPPLPL